MTALWNATDVLQPLNFPTAMSSPPIVIARAQVVMPRHACMTRMVALVYTVARKARVSLGTVTGEKSLAKQLNWRQSTEKFGGLEEIS
jgi:hypothetical protein